MLDTNRLILRKARPEDAREILGFINSDFVMRYNFYNPYNEARLWKLAAGGMDYVIIEKKSERIIGMIGIEDDTLRFNRESVSLTYMLAEEFTHKGYMREALREILEEIFVTMNKELISLRIVEENSASRRLAETLGFHLDGIIRQAILRYDGKEFNDCIYSLLKQEFEENLEI